MTNLSFIFDAMQQDGAQDKGKVVDRKKDHIDMAFESSIASNQLDSRFFYEPMLAGHPSPDCKPNGFEFLGKRMHYPIWVSSMTGGTKWAARINENLARVCGKYGLGMGLGSIRPLLDGRQHFSDFDVRDHIGSEAPLFANIGIAQLQQMLNGEGLKGLFQLCKELRVDGCIVHVNPMQEWLQPEGDRFFESPLESIQCFLNETDMPIIVKEVGHGYGPESISALMQLPLAAIDFGANGGTNFSKLEMMRSEPEKKKLYEKLAYVGHDAEEMVRLFNALKEEEGADWKCQSVIISGGVRDFLDGYYLTELLQHPAVYGQAASFLRYAKESYEELDAYVAGQIEGFDLCKKMLRVRK